MTPFLTCKLNWIHLLQLELTESSTYPLNLTNPDTIPDHDDDPLYYPKPTMNLNATQQASFVQAVFANVTKIITSSPNGTSNCTICKNALQAAKPAALAAPTLLPAAFVALCEATKFKTNASCEESFAADTFGDVWAQILAYGNMTSTDGDYICNYLSSTFCPKPKTPYLNTTGLFPKPKPANASALVPKANGKRVKVLHLSDFHLDPRYKVGSEGNCASNLCCRANNPNPGNASILLPAPLYGTFKCDSPYNLGLAALQAIGPLTGTGGNTNSSIAMTLYTGDLVSHDPQSELSRAYVEYTELSVYSMFKKYITGPVYAALGNHDTNPDNTNSQQNLPGPLGQQQSWNYDHVAGLWQDDDWIDGNTAAEARTHYGGYSVKHPSGLRIITWNTDFYYRNNIANFINSSNPDFSGTFAWMIDELQLAEDRGERVWLVGHVLSGWDGSNPLPAGSNLFYQIVERYSPHVIANAFFGHTHEDQFMIYYANNGTNQTAGNALSTGWIGPSVTPLTNLNSGFRMYEVDTGDFNIYEAYTFYSNVSAYPSLNASGPTYKFEYSTREVYGAQANWSSTAPLNATFWHKVTEAMEQNITLVSLQNSYMGKLSSKSPNCTNTACQKARICYMRSGSVALGSQCPQG